MVLNWSWLRSVCRTRWPSGTCRTSIGEATNSALPDCGFEGPGVARRVRHDEAARPVDVHLVGLAAGHHPGDVCPDDAVILTHGLPGNVVPIPDGGLRDAADDFHL